MERTESKSIQVHPKDEQYFIDVMQHFHYNLQSSQEVNIRDSHLEVQSGKLYSVTESQRYVKLIFTRPSDFVNKEKVIELENEFLSMKYQKTKGTSCWVTGMIIFSVIIIIGAIIILINEKKNITSAVTLFIFFGILLLSGILLIKNNNKNNQKIIDANKKMDERKAEILGICNSLD